MAKNELEQLFKRFKLDRETQRQVNSFKKEFLGQGGVWGIVTLVAVGIVIYLVLANKDLTNPPFPIVDPLIDRVGDIPVIGELEGAYPENFPDPLESVFPIETGGLFGGGEDETTEANWAAAEAYAAEVGGNITVA